MIITDIQKESIPFQYAADIESGRILSGGYIKKAIARFYSWIDSAKADGFILDHDRGMHIIKFFTTFLTYTKHPNPKKVGLPFELSPFQQFTLYNVFGWIDQNGKRRINEVYDKRAKKNGKTAEMAGVLLYHLSFDGEEEAEGYIGATKEKQAELCLNQAINFIKKSARLRQIGFSVKYKQIHFAPTASFAMALGGDSKTQDGINSSLSVIDEYHAHKDDTVKENLESSSTAREQPITWHITTAGTNLFGVCKNYEDSCKDILDGIVPDDPHRLIMIFDIDKTDDWENPECYIKANPNLDVSAILDNIIKARDKAIIQPSKQPNFKTKNLNMWVGSDEERIPDDIWQKGSAKVKIDNFAKYGCGGGLDLSSTTDLSAYVLVSNPDPEGIRDILPFVFCPSFTIDQRSKADRVPYNYWDDLPITDYTEYESEESAELYKFLDKINILIATEGNQIDYEQIEEVILQTFWLFGVKWIDFDRWKSTELVQRLIKKDVEMSPVAQTTTFYHYPTIEFERLAYTGKLRHGGNPILRWCIRNLKTVSNVNEYIRYTKSDHKKRIDPIIGAVMGLSVTITEEEEEEEVKPSKYNDPDTPISFGIDNLNEKVTPDAK